MYTQSHSKNNYILSKRNYSFDYSLNKHFDIDMTLSGKFLSNYPAFNLEYNLDEYPSQERINYLVSLLDKGKYNITIGSGSNGILQNIIHILFKENDNLVTPFYSFDQAEYAVTLIGGITKRVFTKNFVIDFDKILQSIDNKTKMIYICNPNNFSGLYIDSKQIIDFCKKTNVLVVIDESSIEFSCNKSVLDYDIPDNMIVLKSFSKAYGLANLRIGYMISSKKFKDFYDNNVTINECSGISIEYAINMIENGYKAVKENIKNINIEINKIINKLNKIEFIESSSNILMTKTYFKEDILDLLNINNISLVKVYDEQKKLHFRIAVQDKETNDKFIYTMKEVIKYENFISN